MLKKAKKIAFISLTSCEGCLFAILDLAEKFLEIAKKVALVDFRLIREEPKFVEKYDLVFIEGNPTLKVHQKILRHARLKAKKLILLGNCAHLGGVWEIKNYHSKDELLKKIYKNYSKIENNYIAEIGALVPIDGFIPGCPINAEEFLQVLSNLLSDQETQIPTRPVCYECQLQENECLLQKGAPCFGPVILGGCRAVCLNNGQPCWGCRGLLKNIQPETVASLLGEINKSSAAEKIKLLTEVFGLRDDLEALTTN